MNTIQNGISSPEWFEEIEEIPFDTLGEEEQENSTPRPEPIGFTLDDAEIVKSVYACSQCEGELQIVPVDFALADEARWFVVCPDCGNIETIGRISKTTVAFRNERGIFDYPRVIRALPDLWGHLITTKEALNKMIHELGF